MVSDSNSSIIMLHDIEIASVPLEMDTNDFALPDTSLIQQETATATVFDLEVAMGSADELSKSDGQDLIGRCAHHDIETDNENDARTESRHSTIREAATERYLASAENIRRILRRKQAAPEDYKKGDVVGVLIDNYERARSEPWYLPCRVHEVNDCDHQEMYRLESQHGILSTMYSTGELADFWTLEFEELADVDVMDTAKRTLSVREAVAKTRIDSGAQFPSTCNCKTKCKTTKCPCKKANMKCSSNCHSRAHGKCENK
ncbi:hypothetical protein BDB00DRAFT_192130 [Zychaea mexicana]|uniref:uncharacterized protein n=1 Tax=Zychaea mexicana TaxID=64656 RepID=UPI0022FE16B5|nr:uncharacterized protein BDB00DRAFT_192130 [Zychaea mexicana]KAI9477055.1 hypothetical protein BDB00DRAFT_192130 [Zychaea mexicana]